MDSIREAAAGAAAGAFGKTLLAPLDRLKLVVQLRGSLKNDHSAYQTARQALGRIIQEEGILALWRGNAPTIYIQAGTTAVNFVFMDLFKKATDRTLILLGMSNKEDDNSKRKQRLIKSFVSGAFAGLTGVTLMYPLGLMRTKLALDMGKETRLYPGGMRDVVKQTYRVNGIRGLYQGYGVAVWSVTLYRMVYLGGYDFCKTELLTRRNLQPTTTGVEQDASLELPFWERFIIAQAVSMAASTVHYPLDSVRRRLMMQSDASEKKYRNGLHCFVQIYREEGLPGYFRGLMTNYARSVGAAVVLVSYDFFKGLLSS